MRSLFFFAFAILISTGIFAQDTVSTNGQKFVLLESVTGAWTGWAPDGIVFLNNTKSTYPKTICVQHHYMDGMVNTQSTGFQQSFNATGYPMGSVDRKLFSGQTKIIMSRADWNSSVATQLASSPNFDITLIYSYNPSTRVITASVTGKALANLTGDYYTNLYIIEDSVTGTGNQYDQKNFSNAITGHPFFGAGDPITGYNHMNVVRDMLGGVFGNTAFSNPAANATYTKNYTYTVPTGYDAQHIRLVATIAKYGSTINDREVQNAVESNAGSMPCSYAPPQVQICVVSVDTTSGKNVIVWEKAGIKHAKEYKIYRETSTPGTYQHIGTKAANLFSTYEDASSNPQAQSYRYKLTVVDSCNREMPLSLANAHQTVHVSFNVLTNNTVYISWVPYSGVSYTTYTIKRSNNGGPYVQIAQIGSGTTNYSDANPPSGVNSYRVEILVPNGCNPSAKNTGYNVIISNATVAWHTGIGGLSGNSEAIIHPNPASDFIILTNAGKVKSYFVYDLTGKVIMAREVSTNSNSPLKVDISTLSDGMYLLKAIGSDDNMQVGRFQKQ